MSIQTQQYLLDENVDRRLRRIFENFSLTCNTLNDFALNGLQNGVLSFWVKENDYVLITHDRDFENFWRVYKIKVILITIHPATIRQITPFLESFLSSYNRELTDSFLINLSIDGIVYQS